MSRTRRSPSPGRVFVHVGAPLTGTTLRARLAGNRRRLARYGVLYPPSHLGHDGGHLDAVLDALDLAAAERPTAAGAWDRLAENVRDWRRGTAVISHELLADATQAQIERIVASFGAAEVHVVYVARDLTRQIPLAWQEWVHNGGTATFPTYVNRVVDGKAHRTSRVFWRSHAFDEVLTRWAAFVPTDRIHLVTVPQAHDPDRVLWQRFAELIGVDADRVKAGTDPSSAPLGMVQNEVLRLLNAERINDADPRRMTMARAALRKQAGVPAAVPTTYAGVLHQRTESMLTAVRSSGYRVVGDLTDLLPVPGSYASPDLVLTEAAVVTAQTGLLALLTEPTVPQRFSRRGGPVTPRGPAGFRRWTLARLRLSRS